MGFGCVVAASLLMQPGFEGIKTMMKPDFMRRAKMDGFGMLLGALWKRKVVRAQTTAATGPIQVGE